MVWITYKDNTMVHPGHQCSFWEVDDQVDIEFCSPFKSLHLVLVNFELTRYANTQIYVMIWFFWFEAVGTNWTPSSLYTSSLRKQSPLYHPQKN